MAGDAPGSEARARAVDGAAGHTHAELGGGGGRRTLRIAARYADAWNVWGRPEFLARKGAVLDAHCAAVGRDPAALAARGCLVPP